MLKLVIPKGSLEEQTLRLFEAADLRVAQRLQRIALPGGGQQQQGQDGCLRSPHDLTTS